MVAMAEPQRSKQEIEKDVVEALKTVYDPEIPVDIYELGLVYNVDVRDDRSVEVRLTLTSPMCPVAGSLPPEVEAKVAQVPGVASAIVDLVWDPPWNPSMMSEAAKLELGMD
jgi:FeS assembly SUF system protein